MRDRILLVLKISWIGAVAVAVLVYGYRHSEEIAETLARIPTGRVLLSIALYLTGGAALIVLARLTLAGLRPAMTPVQFFRIYAFTLLGKYLPGGIWQFVGRLGFYRRHGVPMKRGTQAVLLELAWMAMGSALAGVAFAWPRLLEVWGVVRAAELTFWSHLAGSLTLLPVGFVVYALVSGLVTRRVRWHWRLFAASAACHVVIWFAYGLSFWALLPSDLQAARFTMLVMGSFALAWCAGLCVPIAPAGIGVREAVLALLLAGLMAPAEALIVAGLHRVIWTVGELTMGGVALLLPPGPMPPPSPSPADPRGES